MEPKLQQHFAALNSSFGISTINQLKSLGQADTAGNLQTSVAACIQQDFQACLVRMFRRFAVNIHKCPVIQLQECLATLSVVIGLSGTS